MASAYEPIGEETLELADEIVPVKPRRKRKAAAAGASGAKIAAIVVLIVLIAAIVALAIALPIVLTRRTQQNAIRNADLSINPDAATGGAARSATTPSNANSPNAGANPGSAFAVAPVSPDRNTGNNVYCYRSPITGGLLEGAFLATGETSIEDGISRTEVQSCGSGSKMFLSTSQLVLCTLPCLTPSWQAVQNGMIAPPIWNQQYVCRGDQVYENRLTPRFSFYWRYAGFVQEQLITRCDSNDAWWIPNIELRFCQEHEIVKCQVSSLSRSQSRGAPVMIQGVPSGVSLTARPICHLQSGTANLEVLWATGVVVNRYVWSRVRFMDLVEATPCANRNAEKIWVRVDEMVPCPDAVAAGCTVAPEAATINSQPSPAV